jgi:F0F1-type ATP synthase assembly protein I
MAEEKSDSLPEDSSDGAPSEALRSGDIYPSPPEIAFQRPELSAQGKRRGPVRPELSPVSSHGAARVGAGLAAGVTFAASIIAGFLIGQWVDHRWNHTSFPWGMLVFTLLGVAAGFINLLRLTSATERKKPK